MSFIDFVKASFQKTHNRRSAYLFAATLAAIVAALWFYWGATVSTDDAYINANVSTISTQITAKVTKLYANNNQFVKSNQVLIELDQTPFKIARDRADAQLAMSKAEWINAKNNAKRIEKLFNQHAVSQQNYDDACTQLKAKFAAFSLAKAELHQAELNLKYTIITAPTTGWLTNFKIREGDVVTADQPLFSLVNNDVFWVDANFKETELKDIKPGQSAIIKVDMHPGIKFKGIVDSISYGSGNAFSLLPPQNATGNWVKVTQRVPVKVMIINPNSKYPLRIGTSATVSIHTRS